MTTVYPAQIRSLADERDTSRTRRHKSYLRDRRRSLWGLDIAGPFCMFPRRSKNDTGNHVLQLVDQISALLAMPVTFVRDNDVVDIHVTLTAAEKERIFKKEYARETEAK